MKLEKVKAIIFDMDGVLVDSEPLHIEIEKRMFKKAGLDISDEEHARYMGTATDVMWTEIKSSRNLSFDVDEMTRLTIAEAHPFFNSLEKIDPMPGLEELLQKCVARRIPMAVASSSDKETIRIILKKSGLKTYFQHVVSSSEVGKSKPEPDVFLHAAHLLGVVPKNCIVIEDSKNGIKAAKAAGMYCVAYNGVAAENQDQSQADIIINDYSTLKDFLNQNI
ncbi:HAD family phosphatase [Prolixibacteraceae bacterium Z1-6]|uniref:HAD family phosphatase n=1 Tax=Draconibacterium aestuarii TaxID=2998507 RepID=A0A9X3F2P0_9BACT|nr:HAD family phosphatase [Prolixibacteraceae bacterium Z1-6]